MRTGAHFSQFPFFIDSSVRLKLEREVRGFTAPLLTSPPPAAPIEMLKLFDSSNEKHVSGPKREQKGVGGVNEERYRNQLPRLPPSLFFIQGRR